MAEHTSGRTPSSQQEWNRHRGKWCRYRITLKLSQLQPSRISGRIALENHRRFKPSITLKTRIARHRNHRRASRSSRRFYDERQSHRPSDRVFTKPSSTVIRRSQNPRYSGRQTHRLTRKYPNTRYMINSHMPSYGIFL